MTVMGEKIMKKITSPKRKFAFGLAGALLCATILIMAPPNAVGEEAKAKAQEWSFSGPFKG